MARRTAVVLVAGMLLFGNGALAKAFNRAPSGLPDLENPKVIMAGQVGRYGGTLVYSVLSDPRTFNPVIIAQQDASTNLLARVFDGLVETNYDTTEIEPALAESWTTSQDGRTWTLSLRKGVRFHDGVEFTADDVIFNMEAAFTQGVQTTRRDTLTIGGKPIKWRRVDAYTVELKTDEPFGPFLRAMTFRIVPKHKLETVLKVGGVQFNKSWGVNTPPRNIVGTGPFIMQSYVPSERVVFLRNQGYWKIDRSGNRLPYLARHVLLIVPNLETARLKFQGAESDLYPVRPAEFAQFKAGEKIGKYTIYEAGPWAGPDFIVLNQNPQTIKAPKLTWFSSTKFRQAISYAIDRTAVANQVYGGRARPQFGPLTSSHKFFFNPNVKQFPYDPARAQALLAETGLTKGMDGTLRDGSGNPVEFTLSTNVENTERVAVSNLVRQDLAKLGIKITIEPEAGTTLFGKVSSGVHWDAILFSFGPVVDPHMSQSIWRSSGSLHEWHPNEETPASSWEAEIDRLFDQAAATLDQKRRRQLYNRWQEIVAEQQPLIYLCNKLISIAARNTLANFRPSPLSDVWNIEQVFNTVPFR